MPAWLSAVAEACVWLIEHLALPALLIVLAWWLNRSLKEGDSRREDVRIAVDVLRTDDERARFLWRWATKLFVENTPSGHGLTDQEKLLLESGKGRLPPSVGKVLTTERDLKRRVLQLLGGRTPRVPLIDLEVWVNQKTLRPYGVAKYGDSEQEVYHGSKGFEVPADSARMADPEPAYLDQLAREIVEQIAANSRALDIDSEITQRS